MNSQPKYMVRAGVVVAVIWFGAFIYPADAHEISCSKPKRAEIRNELMGNRKPLQVRWQVGDIFNRATYEDLKDRVRERRQRIREQLDRVYQKAMVRFDACIKRAYDHEEAHAAEQFTPFGNWAIPEWCVMAESGGQNIWNSSGSGASGYYQIIGSTWAGFGGYSDAIYAPKSVQDEKAFYMYQASGLQPWFACS